MFIICFTNSNVDERSCLVSLFGLSVALFSTVFYFCKVTDLASPLFPFFFTLSFLLFLRCSRLHAVVTQLRVFVDCVGLKYLQPGSCFFPSLCLSSSIPLFDHLLWGCQLFDPTHVFEGTRLILSRSPPPRRALASAAKATRVPPPSLKTTFSRKKMDKIMRTCSFAVASWKKMGLKPRQNLLITLLNWFGVKQTPIKDSCYPGNPGKAVKKR